jgi:PAS domain S-box-containing protein
MRVSLKVLLIGESQQETAIVLEELKKGGFDPGHKMVRAAKQIRESLEHDIWDVIICDYDLGGQGGIRALETVHETDIEIPFIFISDANDEEIAVEAMIQGAHDFIRKDKLARLPLVIHRALKLNVMRISHKEALKALKKSESKFRTVVEHATQGIVIIQGGILKYLNPRMIEILDYDRDGLLGNPFIQFIVEEDRENAKTYYQKLLRDRKVDDPYVFRVRSGDGRVKWLENYGVRIEWEGRPAKLIFLRDITRQKRAEEEVQKSSLIIQHKSIALKEVLDEIDAKKDAIKMRLKTNVEHSIIPTLMRLKQSATPAQQRLFEVLENDLMNITSPFLDDIKDEFSDLSPRKLEVCRLIKNGMTSKEIADALGISPMTVHKHREIIRKKLKLVNDGSNLNTYLKSKFTD